MLALLGHATDVAIARRFGLTKDTVKAKRDALGIPVGRHARSRPIARTPALLRLLALPNPVLRTQYGIPKQTAARLRREVGLPTPDSRNARWTPTYLAQLGAVPDAVLATRIGITTGGVSAKRRSLGIAPFHSVHTAWTDAELALLATLPDTDVAARTGRSLEAIALKRRALARTRPRSR